MKSLPFKLTGVYVSKMNPTKDLPKYKASRLMIASKAIFGKKEEHFYNLIVFGNKYEYSDKGLLEDAGYGVGIHSMQGEIFELIDWFKNNGSSHLNCENFVYSSLDQKISMEKGTSCFHGTFDADHLVLSMSNRESGFNESREFRFIPYLKYIR